VIERVAGRPLVERVFRLAENRTTVRTEILAGATTFLTMAYIIFVQPAVLSAAGMDFGAVLVATCVSSAIATLMMGLMANYPIAVAPGMGQNFFFAYTVVVGMQVPWQAALGAVFLSGAIFVATAGYGLRERLIIAIPDSLKHAIAVGIGLMIAAVGLQWAGIVVASPGTLVTLGTLHSAPVLVSFVGLGVMAVLHARRVRGAIVLGMLAATLAGLLAGVVRYQGIVSQPPSIAPTFLQLDIAGAFTPRLGVIVLVFFLLALFDTVGTLVGVAEQGGFMRNGTLPRARQAFLADAAGTMIGAGLGTSTVTAYIESATGVSAGGRTGFANLVTAALLLLSLFFAPLVRMIGGGYPTEGGPILYPVIAPALVLVGTMMMRNVRLIEWDDPTEAVPAFLAMLVMPLAVSITEGIAFGFIAYSVLKAATGRVREPHWLVHAFAALFLIRYVALR
jgi:AGZA family xanthine/uracil permease-like MFS transporter